MSQFSELIIELADQKNYTLSDVLLKAKVLASRLPGRKFRQWIDSEINGHKRQCDLPAYRILPCRILGDFSGYFQSSMSNVPMSLSHLEAEMRDVFAKHREYNGISYIEDLLSRDTGRIGTDLDGSCVSFMRTHGTQVSDMILNRLFKEVAPPAWRQLLLGVRSRLLDFLLELRDRYPELDKNDNAASSVNPQDIDAVMDSKVYNHCTVIEGGEMRDVFQTGQAGAVGPHAKAENINFIQILREAIGECSLNDLAKDLEKLRAAMLNESKSAHQDAAVAAVSEAETAAKKGDAQGVIAFLKRSGSWALEVATKVGTAVAAKAIERSMEL